jgi:IS5 family transposase
MTNPSDFFRARIDAMIDMRHPLAVLATRMPWAQMEASIAPHLQRKPRTGRHSVVPDLFGTTLQIAGAGVSPAGRPRLPIRMMVSLLYLKHAYGLSDDQVVERWAQDILFQFFSGQEYFEHRLPCDSSMISRFRKDLGEGGVEELLKTTIETAVAIAAVKKTDLQRVIVDTTVAEKAIAHPTDSRLLDVARKKLVRLAQRSGIALKQTYEKECTALRRRAGGYAHAKQFRRLQRVVKRQRTILGVLIREVQRKMTDLPSDAMTQLQSLLTLVTRVWQQKRSDKSRDKVFALHAPEVSCIGKGKSAKPYEFGTKVSIAVAHKPGLVVGARSYPGNPFDGHTLSDQLEQVTNLLQDIGVKPHTAVVDLGFTGVDADNPGVEIIHRRKFKKLSNQQRRWLRRRSAVEPVIGHLKDDHGMRRCWLKGETGDALHAVLCAAGFNIRWLMRAIQAKGIQPLWQLFLRLQFALHWAVQIAMAHVRPSPLTGWLGAFTYPFRAAGVAVRPTFA